MNVIQFLRILWARRWITVLATAGCVVGAVIVVLVVPARWEAHSRIMLDTIKPDPLTGQVIGGNASAYAATQVELIKDYSVASKAVDELGWRSDPELIAAYRRRSKKDTSDFGRWLAQLMIERTDAGLVPGTNILEITYAAPEPRTAKAVADALTRAFVQTSVQFRRQQASHNADWFEAQTEKARDDLDAAATREADFQRQTGIILQDDKVDIESARLHALASEAAAGAPVFAPVTSSGSAAGAELAQVDAAIAQASQTLGPNHPELQTLKAKRSALAAQSPRSRLPPGPRAPPPRILARSIARWRRRNRRSCRKALSSNTSETCMRRSRCARISTTRRPPEPPSCARRL